jgi:hypothetical protein
MSIGIKVGHSWYELGRADYLDSFFSTIAFYLENGHWGSEFPTIMRQMYSGKLTFQEADKAIQELRAVRDTFEKLDKESHPIVWDARDLSAKTPEWAVNPNEEVTTLGNYYVVPDGRDFFEMMIMALEESADSKLDLCIGKVTQY